MKKSGLINLICSLLAIVVLAVAVLLVMAFNGILIVESNELVITSSSSIATYDGNPLTDKGWRLIKGELKEGHRLSVTVSGSQTGVGISENYVTASVINKDGADVSKEYSIIYKPGSLNVRAREIIINANSDMKLFDGQALTNNGYTLSAQSSLIQGHKLTVTVDGTITEIGEALNRVSYYKITDVHGNDVTKNYNVKTNDGKLIVYKQDTLIIESEGNQKYYDGTPLTKDNWYIKNGSLLYEHNINVEIIGTITDVGSQPNDFNVTITDSSGTDVTSYYEIVKSLGTLNVLPTPISIITDDNFKIYDGTPLTCNSFKINNPYKVDLSNFAYALNITGSITEVGVAKNTLDGYKIYLGNDDVTNNFSVTVEEGDLTVIPPENEPEMPIVELTFESSGDEKTYDGTPLTNPNWSLISGELYPNHYAVVEVNGSITNPGVADNDFTVLLLDETQQDVSEYYNVKTQFGELKVFKIDVKVESATEQKVYDGFPLINTNFDIYPSYLKDDYSFDVEVIGSRVDVGVSPNTIANISIYNKNIDNVTDFFNVEKVEGSLEITEVPDDLKPKLVYSSGSATKVYDGTPLTNFDCSLVSGEYYPEHRPVIELLSSITEVGKISNEITVNIYDENEQLVNDKYIIIFQAGTLEVTPINIKISALSKEKNYDGTSLTCNEYEIVPYNALIDGHFLEVEIIGEIVDVGQIPNQITSVKIVDVDNNDFTHCYKVETNDGTLSILDSDSNQNAPSGMSPTGSVPSSGEDEEEPDTVLYYVSSTVSHLAYLRMQSYGDYNGLGWDNQPTYSGNLIIDPLGFAYESLSQGKTIEEITVEKAIDGACDVIPYFYNASLSTYSNLSSNYFIENKNINYYEYSVPVEIQEYELEYRNFVYQNYINLPQSTLDAMLDVITLHSLDKNNPNIISQVAQLVSTQVAYSKTFNYEGNDIAYYFFNGATTGVCTHYATAGTALFRALGIPARYVCGITGYVKKDVVNKLELPLHAWVEVYVDGFGWVPVEVTGSDGNGIGGIEDLPGENDDEGDGDGDSNQEKLAITVKPQNISKVYDGESLTATEISVDGLDLNNYTIEFGILGEQINAGTSASSVDWLIIYDLSGNDVTQNFDISYEEGEIEVTKREVVLVTGSDTSSFDNTAHVCKEITVSENSPYNLVDGHYITAEFTGMQFEIGNSPNYCKNVDILNEFDESVVNNYEILEIEIGTITVTKITLDVNANSASKYYDGTPLVDDGFEYLADCLLEGHKLYATVTGSQTEIGSSTNYLSKVYVLDSDDNDVSQIYYDINLENGILTVIEREITVIAESKSMTYDGTMLTGSNYSYTPIDVLMEGHRLVVNISGVQIEVGSSSNVITSCRVLDENNEDVTAFYSIITQDGNLEVTSPEDCFYVVSDVSTKLYLRRQSYGDYNGQYFNPATPYTDNYNQISPYYFISYGLQNSGLSTNTLKVTPLNNIYVLPYYSIGDSIYNLNDTVARGDTSGQYTVTYYNWSGLSGANLMSAHKDAEAEYSKFVYENYLTIDNETLTYLNTIIQSKGLNKSNPNIINEVANAIKSLAYYDLKFDPALENEENLVIAFLSQYKTGVCRHFAASATMLYRALGIPARYTVGYLKSVNKNEKTTVTSQEAHAWVEVYVNGMGWVNVEVTGSSSPTNQVHEIKVQPVNVSRIFTEGELRATKANVIGFNELNELGYTYEYAIEGVSTQLGKVTTSISSFIIYDPDNNVIYDKLQGITSSNIKVGYYTGEIHQYLDVLKFESESNEKTYDGKELTITREQIHFVSGNIDEDEGYSYEIQEIKSITLAGESSSVFKVVIYKDGKDCTSHYKIDYNYGKLSVIVRDITLTAESAEKFYDGSPLTCNEIIYDEFALAEGDYISSYTIRGSQTNIGISSNVIDVTSIIIKNSSGQNVTSSYQITTIDGELKVSFNK